MPDSTDSVSARRIAPPGKLALDVLERAGLPLFLVTLIVFFAASPSTGVLFRSAANVENIFANQSVTGLVALAMVVPLVSGYFDLSVSAVAGLANVTAAAVIGTHHQPIAVGIVVAIVVATAIGAVNGFLVAGLRLNGFICTLGTYTLVGGLLEWYTQGQTITNGIPQSLGNWSSGKWLGVASPFWLLMVVAIVLWYLLMQTPFGRKLEAIGSNESAARLTGIRVRRVVFLSFVISGLLAGLAGALLTSSSGGANPTAGPAYLFPALAAVFLGQTAIRPGRYNVWGTVFGVFFVAVAVDGLTLAGAQSWVQPVFNGAALVISVGISTFMGRSKDRRSRSALLRTLRQVTSPVPGATVPAARAVSSAPDAAERLARGPVDDAAKAQ